MVSPRAMLMALTGAVVTWAFLPDDGTPATFIHATFRRETWREGGFWGGVVWCAGFVVWPAYMLVTTAVYTARLGPSVRHRTGKGLLRQAGEQLFLSLTRSIPPRWYYLFEFHDDRKRHAALEYLYRLETKSGIYEFLRKYLSSPETTDALRSKAGFALHCLAHHVPAVVALAKVEHGTITRFDGVTGGLPRRHLFVKPMDGAGGRGASVWKVQPNGSYRSDTGAVLSETELIDHLETVSQRQSYVVRSYVANRDDLADLSPGALSTVRVLTCLDEHGGFEVTHAVMRMARTPDVVVDNFHAGGIAAKVDIRTGILGRATNMGLTRDTGWWDVHPTTGAQITGRQLPMWREVLDVARRGHAAFPDQVAVGWDIALLEDGPELVEGNKSPDLDIIQRTHEEPIGNSRFGELFAFNIRRALDEKYGRSGSPERRTATPTRDDSGPARMAL
jgi:hypothetical protein